MKGGALEDGKIGHQRDTLNSPIKSNGDLDNAMEIGNSNSVLFTFEDSQKVDDIVTMITTSVLATFEDPHTMITTPESASFKDDVVTRITTLESAPSKNSQKVDDKDPRFDDIDVVTMITAPRMSVFKHTFKPGLFTRFRLGYKRRPSRLQYPGTALMTATPRLIFKPGLFIRFGPGYKRRPPRLQYPGTALMTATPRSVFKPGLFTRFRPGYKRRPPRLHALHLDYMHLDYLHLDHIRLDYVYYPRCKSTSHICPR